MTPLRHKVRKPKFANSWVKQRAQTLGAHHRSCAASGRMPTVAIAKAEGCRGDRTFLWHSVVDWRAKAAPKNGEKGRPRTLWCMGRSCSETPVGSAGTQACDAKVGKLFARLGFRQEAADDETYFAGFEAELPCRMVRQRSKRLGRHDDPPVPSATTKNRHTPIPSAILISKNR